MAVTALIKFTQAASPGTAGVAYTGSVAGGAVTVENGDNSNVNSWTITLLDVPPGSALVPGVLATATSPTPSASFTPDVAGSYRIMLDLADISTGTSRDIRNFGIPNARGVIVPSYQKVPDPLPVPGSLSPLAKPNEQNYGSQTRGWTGNRSDGQLEYFFSTYDDLPFQTVATTPFNATVNDRPIYYVNVSGAATFNLPSSVRTGQQFRITTDPTVTVLTVVPPGGHTILGLSSFQVIGYGTVTLIYRGSSSWVVLGAKKYLHRLPVATYGDSTETSFQAIGGITVDPSVYPNILSVTWEVLLETDDITDQAQIRLFNMTTLALVSGSTLSTAGLDPTLLTASVTLTAGSNVYEAQLRLASVGAPHRATCKAAHLLVSGVQ